MSKRRIFWVVGLVATAVVMTWVSIDPDRRGVFAVGFVLAWGIAGLGFEIGPATRAGGRPGSFDRSPADGVIGITAAVGTIGVPNAVDPRFRRFGRFDGEASEAGGERPGVRPLLGRVAVCSLFVGLDGVRWSDAEIARALASLEAAAAWIEREAIRWGAAVNVDLAEIYFEAEDEEVPAEVAIEVGPEGDATGLFERGATTAALASASRAVAGLGFNDAADWVERVGPRLRADTRLWILHPRRAGRSIAIPSDLDELGGLALAVCYPRYANFSEPLDGRPPGGDSATLVHEVLHLFGASDKYGFPIGSFPAGSVSSRDIMRLDRPKLARLRVDPLTAMEIGWGRRTPAKVDSGRPPRAPRSRARAAPGRA